MQDNFVILDKPDDRSVVGLVK